MAATLDFEPPAACVTRIVKSILPSNVMLTKEAKAALTRAAGIFIFYLTHCANEFTKEGKRSTIFAQDIKNALRELDFEDFEAPLDEFLESEFSPRTQPTLISPPTHSQHTTTHHTSVPQGAERGRRGEEGCQGGIESGGRFWC